jgi:hypothetical protein
MRCARLSLQQCRVHLLIAETVVVTLHPAGSV